MTTDNDVTLLFERNTVAQVQELLIKTRNDIERKKEDLRVMVGERYRDLIEAADTIAEMRQSADLICSNIQTMEGLCESLQQRGLIGFKTQNHQQSTNTERWLTIRGSHYAIAVQVKILVSVPEVLWSLTESRDFLPAAQLFLQAQHTHTALQLFHNAPKVLGWFPVIDRQWSSIAQFRQTIVRGSSYLISHEIDDFHRVTNATVAIMLIEGCGIDEILTRILALRKTAILSSVTPKPSATAKSQISEFVTLFISSINIVYELFADDEEGCSRLENCVKEMLDSWGVAGTHPLNLLQETSLAISFLPPSVLNFRPTIRGSIQSIGNDAVKDKMVQWVNNLFKQVDDSLSVLLAYTMSVKNLSLIRSCVFDICKESLEKSEWNKITTLLYGSVISPWDLVIRPLVKQRAEQVVMSQLLKARESVVEMVSKLADNIISDPKICNEEGDLTPYIWKESAGDIPEFIGWTSANSRSLTQAGGLYYKTHGYTSRLKAICLALNSRLAALLDDVAHFAPAVVDAFLLTSYGHSMNGNEVQLTALEDYASLVTKLQKETCSTFTKLVVDLESLAQKHLASSTHVLDGCENTITYSMEPSASSTVVIFIGRVCSALSNICPHLQTCASATSLTQPDAKRRISLGSKLESESWSKLHTELQRASSQLIGLFLESSISQLKKELYLGLKAEIQTEAESLALAIAIFPSWESVDIEEEGEDGNMVKSCIFVPAHPTPSLTQSLYHLCSAINCVASHTITRPVQSLLVMGVCDAVTSVYESIAEDLMTTNQTLALQLIFDLKFLQLSILPRDCKDLGSRLNVTIQKFESKVDPFDLDVFLPHVSNRVKLAVHRAQVVIGIVLARDRQVMGGRPIPSLHSSSSNNNSLPVVPAVEIPRFSNVPLPLSSLPSQRPSSLLMPNNMLGSDSVDGMSEKKFVSKDDLSPNVSRASREMSSAALTASRSAASLFSAMSSSWFGSTAS